MVNNSTNINKTNRHLSRQLIACKKKYDIWRWKCMSWLGTGTEMWRG